MFAILEFSDFSIILAIVVIYGSSSAVLTSLKSSSERRFVRLERKLNLILKHLGIEDVGPTNVAGLSEEVRMLADDPSKKIPAIKLHREQTGVGLKEAKDAVEAYMNGATETPPK